MSNIDKKGKGGDGAKGDGCNLSEMELAACCWIRVNIECHFSIPFVIKSLVGKFVKNTFIKSNILSWNDDMKLGNLLQNQLSKTNKFINIKSCNLLFRGSDYEFSADEFHKKCDNDNDNYKTIVIVESTFGNKFGGYTSKSWKNNTSSLNFYKKDSSAFLFLLSHHQKEEQNKCPLVFEIKPQEAEFAIYCVPSWDPTFGDGLDLFIDDHKEKPDLKHYEKKQHFNTSSLKSFRNDKYSLDCLDGGNMVRSVGVGANKRVEYLFRLVDYEVFEVIIEDNK